ncbi:tripartite tricarboxylate transporter TctB family protein [Ovoidimarina sediminis]|uniref:tripartite tricarboxylate transporter TctB family protein n=1 Tax=Ovoidimarina sediminis TaxID=3079856 RepID=UPI00290A4E2A|nr:tripartite tricarboxylate transporter TctB family protein [Rhodophyticola sp. MJ-SS7]MDU8941803.1 tripartite tricarboxylate transporter TctB family protein [Rhodophyticola sp. MJ-SS7]
MPSDPETTPEAAEAAKTRHGNMFALEICFLAFIAVVTVAAFFEALTYKLVSSRTPFVIMVPLLILIAIHARRLWRVREGFDPRARIAKAFGGQVGNFNKVLGISTWMVGMVLMILVLGHYAGVFLFCVILMRMLAGEEWMLTVLTAAGVTLFIWGVFEFIFDISLYRGLIIRYFLGFRDFG